MPPDIPSPAPGDANPPTDCPETFQEIQTRLGGESARSVFRLMRLDVLDPRFSGEQIALIEDELRQLAAQAEHRKGGYFDDKDDIDIPRVTLADFADRPSTSDVVPSGAGYFDEEDDVDSPRVRLKDFAA